MIEDQSNLEKKLLYYQKKMTLWLIIKLVLTSLLTMLLVLMVVFGMLRVDQTPKALFLFIVPIGISINVFHSWLKRRKNLAYMREHELRRLSANPYNYAIDSATLSVKIDCKNLVEDSLLRHYFGVIRYPSIFHGVLWMRFLYAAIATGIGSLVAGFLGVKSIFGFSLFYSCWIFFAVLVLFIIMVNFRRSILIYQYGIINQTLFSRERIWFKDIYHVTFEKTYASKGKKLESALLMLQCIGQDVSFYVSDASSHFYADFEQMSDVIYKSSQVPHLEDQKPMPVDVSTSVTISLG